MDPPNNLYYKGHWLWHRHFSDIILQCLLYSDSNLLGGQPLDLKKYMYKVPAPKVSLIRTFQCIYSTCTSVLFLSIQCDAHC